MNRYLIVELFCVSLRLILQAPIRGARFFQRGLINFESFFLDVFLGRPLQQHAKLTIPVADTLVTAPARQMRGGGGWAFCDPKHWFAIAGRELRQATKLGWNGIEKKPCSCRTTHRSHVAEIGSHFVLLYETLGVRLS